MADKGRADRGPAQSLAVTRQIDLGEFNAAGVERLVCSGSGAQATPAKAGARICRRHAGGTGGALYVAHLMARIYGVFALQCSKCGGRVHLVGFITEPAPVRQIPEHVGERTTAPVIAAARSPPLAMNGQQLAAPEGVFEAIPELEFDQTANLAAEAGHNLHPHPAGADAEPVPELEFGQTLGL